MSDITVPYLKKKVILQSTVSVITKVKIIGEYKPNKLLFFMFLSFTVESHPVGYRYLSVEIRGCN